MKLFLCALIILAFFSDFSGPSVTGGSTCIESVQSVSRLCAHRLVALDYRQRIKQ